MKDAYEVLRQKEADLARVRHEIESLTLTASLLRDESSENLETQIESSTETRLEHGPEPKATGTEGLFSAVSDSHPRFWGVLKRKR